MNQLKVLPKVLKSLERDLQRYTFLRKNLKIKGSSSLVKKSVYGLFNTTSKITGSIGKG
jgi:hypothetical protein